MRYRLRNIFWPPGLRRSLRYLWFGWPARDQSDLLLGPDRRRKIKRIFFFFFLPPHPPSVWASCGHWICLDGIHEWNDDDWECQSGRTHTKAPIIISSLFIENSVQRTLEILFPIFSPLSFFFAWSGKHFRWLIVMPLRGIICSPGSGVLRTFPFPPRTRL